MIKKGLKVIIIIISIYCAVHAIFLFKEANKVLKPYGQSYVLTLEQGTTCPIDWKQQSAEEQITNIAFFSENQNAAIRNEELNRTSKSLEVIVSGNTTLLFPNQYPLEPGDEEGCLISEKTAKELFGDTRVIGNTIQYKEKTYVIRSIIHQSNPFFVRQVTEAEKNDMKYEQVIVKNMTKKSEMKIIQSLKNTYQLEGQISPLYWNGIHGKEKSLSDWYDTIMYFMIKQNNCVEIVYFYQMNKIIVSLVILCFFFVILMGSIILRVYINKCKSVR